jgi:nitrogen fixation protein NifU and related proteins
MNDALYHDALMALAKDTSHAAALTAGAGVTVDNPLCGDRVTLDAEIVDGIARNIRHRVRGCALCQASAAALAQTLEGKPVAALDSALATVESVLAGGTAEAPWGAFAPVVRHKSRHDCVKLPFSAAKSLFSRT